MEGFRCISFSSQAKERKMMTSRGFLMEIQVRVKLHQGLKALRSILGGICGRLMAIHHQSETKKLEGVLMASITYVVFFLYCIGVLY